MFAGIGTEGEDGFEGPFVVAINEAICGLDEGCSQFLGVCHFVLRLVAKRQFRFTSLVLGKREGVWRAAESGGLS